MTCLTLSICFVSLTLQQITAASTDCVFLPWVIFKSFTHQVFHTGIVRGKDNWGHNSSNWSEPNFINTLRADWRSQRVSFRLTSETSQRLFAVSVSTCQFVACSCMSVCRLCIQRLYCYKGVSDYFKIIWNLSSSYRQMVKFKVFLRSESCCLKTSNKKET